MWAYVALAGAQVISAAQQAEMIQKQAKVQQRINEINAEFSELNAWEAMGDAQGEAARYDTQVSDVLGKQHAAFSGADVQIGYGTAGAVDADTRTMGMLNVLELQRRGRQQAFQHKIQAINQRLSGYMTGLQADIDAGAAIRQGTFAAAQTGIEAMKARASQGTGNSSKSGTPETPQFGPDEQKPADPKKVTKNGHPYWWFGYDPQPYYQPTKSHPVEDR
jgi:opacity protein-like surface antigen